MKNKKQKSDDVKIFSKLKWEKVVKAADLDVEDARILVASINNIAEGVAAILTAGLTRRALAVLLADHTGVNRREINLVLDGLKGLKSYALK